MMIKDWGKLAKEWPKRKGGNSQKAVQSRRARMGRDYDKSEFFMGEEASKTKSIDR